MVPLTFMKGYEAICKIMFHCLFKALMCLQALLRLYNFFGGTNISFEAEREHSTDSRQSLMGASVAWQHEEKVTPLNRETGGSDSQMSRIRQIFSQVL